MKAKVRSQVRKGQRPEYPVIWGRHELLNDFYDVFAIGELANGRPVLFG